MNPSFDYRALWMKAKLFLNHAMDDGVGREFNERALWASLAFELLAKAALAKASPLLVADPVADDGVSMMAASGLVTHDGPVVTVRAKAALSRCARAFKPFDAKEAGRIVGHRNDYLHGGNPRFTPIPEDAFWPRYWAQAVFLVEALDEDIYSLVGRSRTAAVEEYLNQNKRNLDERYDSRLARARQRLTLRDSGRLPAHMAGEFAPRLANHLGFSHWQAGVCPACGSEGRVEGDEVVDSEWVEDVWPFGSDEEEMSGEPVYELTVAMDVFSCPNCHLALEGYEMLERAGLPTEMKIMTDPGDYYEPEYNNE